MFQKRASLLHPKNQEQLNPSVKPISKQQQQTQPNFLPRKVFEKAKSLVEKKSIGKGRAEVELGDNLIGGAGGHVSWSSLGARKE